MEDQSITFPQAMQLIKPTPTSTQHPPMRQVTDFLATPRFIFKNQPSKFVWYVTRCKNHWNPLHYRNKKFAVFVHMNSVSTYSESQMQSSGELHTNKEQLASVFDSSLMKLGCADSSLYWTISARS